MKTLITLCMCIHCLFGEPDKILTNPQFSEAPSIREYLFDAGQEDSGMRWQDLRPGYGLFIRIPHNWGLLENPERDGILPGEILAGYTSPEGYCKLSISVMEASPWLLPIFGKDAGKGMEKLGYADMPGPSFRHLKVDGHPAVLITAHGTHCYSKDHHSPFPGYNEMLLVLMPGYILNIRVSYAYADQPHNTGKKEMERRVERELTRLGQAVMYSTRLMPLPCLRLLHTLEPLRKHMPWKDINTDYGLSFSLPREARVEIPSGKDSAELVDLVEFRIRHKEASLKSSIYLQPPSLARSTAEHASNIEQSYKNMEPQWRSAFKALLENSFMNEIDHASGAALNVSPVSIGKISGHTALISQGSIAVPSGAGSLSSVHWHGQVWTSEYLLSLYTYILFDDKLPEDQSGRTYLEEIYLEFLGTLNIVNMTSPFSADSCNGETDAP